jgi:hypothetical protein
MIWALSASALHEVDRQELADKGEKSLNNKKL